MDVLRGIGSKELTFAEVEVEVVLPQGFLRGPYGFPNVP